jgi:hypothetical protein
MIESAAVFKGAVLLVIGLLILWGIYKVGSFANLLAVLKQTVADSTSFADFQTRMALL